MKSKISLTIVYVVLIIYFKVRLPEYTCAELENDLKITLYACYHDAFIPLWKHFMYGDDGRNVKEAPFANKDNVPDTSKRKSKEEKSILNSKKGCSEHFDSWKIKDDLRIHPIDDVGPLKSKLSCTDGSDNFKSKPRNSKRDEIRKLEDDIVVTTIQILSSNMNPSKGVPTNKPSTVEPPKENKSTSQFGEYVPSIQQWEDKSRTTGTRPPTCNC